MKLGNAQQPVKRKVEFAIEKKAKVRMIESKDKRIVHYLFNPGFPSKQSAFCNKLTRL